MNVSGIGSLAIRLSATVVLGGLLTAVLVRSAPGFGSDEQMLDARRDAVWQERARERRLRDASPAAFAAQWLSGYLRGDLGLSSTFAGPLAA